MEAIIERLIGTMMGAVHLLPGTTSSDPAQKGVYRSENSAVLTLNELERWLGPANRGRLPSERAHHVGPDSGGCLARGVGARPRAVREPRDRERFFLDFLPGQRRLIRRDGVWLFHLRYWHDVFSPLAGRSPKPVLIKYDPRQPLAGLLARRRRPVLEASACGSTMRRCAGCEPRAQQQVDERRLMAVVLQQRELVEQARSKTAQRRLRRQAAGGSRPRRR
jgi:putative transposase